MEDCWRRLILAWIKLKDQRGEYDHVCHGHACAVMGGYGLLH